MRPTDALWIATTTSDGPSVAGAGWDIGSSVVCLSTGVERRRGELRDDDALPGGHRRTQPNS